MKYWEEKAHPGLESSLRIGETARRIVGDPRTEWRDMSAEQRRAFRKPSEAEARVLDDEADQGRTH